ncbi:putative conserved membrane protein [Synechococcus sp. ROS8604]|nr:putative conserved membrane protein [Synechococcus sp. ROS8604]
MRDLAMTPSSPSQRWVPLLLGVLALLDLRVELQLLVDHLTLTSLIFAIRHHLLAVVVIVLLPSMWRHYRPVRRSEP